MNNSEDNLFSYTKGCLLLFTKNETIEPILSNLLRTSRIADTIPIEEWKKQRIARDGTKDYHLTIVPPASLSSTIRQNKSVPEDAEFFIMGVVRKPDLLYLPCCYPAGEKFCRENGIPVPDFHFTIGFAKSDTHGIRKDITTIHEESTLFLPDVERYLNYLEQHPQSYGQNAQRVIAHLHSLKPDHPEIKRWYIKTRANQGHLEDALQELDSLIEMESELGSNKGIIAKIRLLDRLKRYDPILLESLFEKLSALASPVSEEILNFYRKHGNNKYYYLLNQDQLLERHYSPINFSPITDHVYASGVVSQKHIPLLRALGITTIINLMEKVHETAPSMATKDSVTPIASSKQGGSGLTQCPTIKFDYQHFPIDDRKTTTKERVNQIVDLIRDRVSNGKKVIIHCLGGKGRTAMIFYAYLIREMGLQIYQIQDQFRESRSTILSPIQQEFLRDYQTHPHNSRLRELGSPQMIVMVGLPGSGKSTLSEHLVKYCEEIHRVNGDEIGKEGCHQEIEKIRKLGKNQVILVDNCNLTRELREEWTYGVKGKVICLHMATPIEECLYRAEHRPNHPTLANERARGVITKLAEQYEILSEKEGFSKIYQFRSPEEVNRQLREWKIDPLPDLEPVDQTVRIQIVKFPRTRHLYNLGSASRDDLLLTPEQQKEFLNREVYVEEKIDGANFGISINPEDFTLVCQNRSHFVNSKYAPQFKNLDLWLHDHTNDLFSILTPGQHILFGEWVYAQHSIHYTRLPGYFVVFDLYDRKTEKFWSRSRLEKLLEGTQLPLIRLIRKASFKKISEFVDLVRQHSVYYDGPIEGVYVKVPDAQDEWVESRGKIVRDDFICGNQHWSKGKMIVNQLEDK